MNRTKIRSLHSVLNLRLIAPWCLSIFLITPQLNAYPEINQEAIVLHKLLKNPTLEAVFKKAAQKYSISSVTLSSIAILESNLNPKAYNAVSKDSCLMQINHKTAKTLNLDTKRLMFDVEYCINAGAQILSYFKKRFAHREAHVWKCRYNLGNRKNIKNNKICLAYLKKLEKIQSKVMFGG